MNDVNEFLLTWGQALAFAGFLGALIWRDVTTEKPTYALCHPDLYRYEMMHYVRDNPSWSVQIIVFGEDRTCLQGSFADTASFTRGATT